MHELTQKNTYACPICTQSLTSLLYSCFTLTHTHKGTHVCAHTHTLTHLPYIHMHTFTLSFQPHTHTHTHHMTRRLDPKERGGCEDGKREERRDGERERESVFVSIRLLLLS